MTPRLPTGRYTPRQKHAVAASGWAAAAALVVAAVAALHAVADLVVAGLAVMSLGWLLLAEWCWRRVEDEYWQYAEGRSWEEITGGELGAWAEAAEQVAKLWRPPEPGRWTIEQYARPGKVPAPRRGRSQ